MRIVAPLCLILILLVAVGLAACAPAAAPEPTPPVEQPTSAAEPTLAPPTATPAPPAGEAPASTSIPVPVLELSSAAFQPGAEIPVRYSCQGANLSPPVAWSGVTQGTRSLALLVDDPDSQPPGFVHWVMYNIPAAATGLPEGVPPEPSLPDGALQGKNDFADYPAGTFPGGSAINQVGYDGPCPPDTHRYVFTLYALDAVLDLPAEATKADLLLAIEGHVLGEVELTGVFTPPQA
jgi:Raf kinase inhibitor-like YbhB/YbcL family protein